MGSKGVGGFKDWMQRKYDNPVPNITLELGRSDCPVSFAEYPVIWEQNKEIPALFCHYALAH